MQSTLPQAQSRQDFHVLLEKASFHFNRNGDYLRFTDWRFIHRAHLSHVPLYDFMAWLDDDQNACHVCGWHLETLLHIINNYNPRLHRGTLHHNKIVARIKEAVSRKWKVISENQFIRNTDLKPDLVLIKGKELLVIDVTCPFDNGYSNFITARKDKVEKYAPFANHYNSVYKKVNIEAIVVGSLGSWDPKNDKILLKLCTKKYLKLRKKLIVSEVVHSSTDIYNHHVSEVPQIDYRSL